MKLFRHYGNIPAASRGSVLAIGNFDGIHRGHQGVLAEAGRLAESFGAPHAVLTFEPHPRQFFKSDGPPFRLTPFRIKARLIEALGIDCLFCLRFNRALSSMTAEEFVTDILVGGLATRHVVVGDNFCFGRGRGGDIGLLKSLGETMGFGVSSISRILGPAGEDYSSTRVRDYLLAGNPTRAALLLGRYYEVEGRVRPGGGAGRALGFPTANLLLLNTICPASGAYAVRAGIDKGAATRWHGGFATLTPEWDRTAAGLVGPPRLKVHLFDNDQDLTGRHMRIALVDYLRPPIEDPAPEVLKAQYTQDAERARVILAAEDWDASWPATPFTAATGPVAPGKP